MNDALDIAVRDYLEGDLPADREREVLHAMADDPGARRLLRLELSVRDASASASTPAVSADFTERTMAAIEAGATLESASSEPAASESAPEPQNGAARSWIDEALGWLWAPRPIRPAIGLVMAAVIVVVAQVMPLAWGPSDGPAGPSVAASESASAPAQRASMDAAQPVVWTRFMYTSEDASSVAVAGDFSDWEPIALTRREVEGRTVWTGLVPVSKGEHQYMFVVDGSKWVTDPLAPIQREDGFGNKNAVLKL